VQKPEGFRFDMRDLSMFGRIFWALLIFCSGFMAHFLFANKDQIAPQSSPVPQTHNCPSISDEKLKAEISRLNNVLRDLDKPASAQTSGAKATAEVATPVEKAGSEKEQELSKLREYRVKTEIAKHQEYLKAIGANASNQVTALRDHFSAEPVDEPWAKHNKLQLDKTFSQSEVLSNLPILSSECRSQQCRIQLLSDEQFYLADLHNSFQSLVGDEGQQFNSYTLVVDPATHSTSIYFTR
jgi:hypothetical protein